MQRLEQRGEIDGVRQIELRVEVDRPAAVARALVQQHAVVVHLAHQLEAVDDALARVVGGIAVGAEARIHTGARRILQRAVRGRGKHGGVHST